MELSLKYTIRQKQSKCRKVNTDPMSIFAKDRQMVYYLTRGVIFAPDISSHSVVFPLFRQQLESPTQNKDINSSLWSF